jgi:hypothetical protein
MTIKSIDTQRSSFFLKLTKAKNIPTTINNIKIKNGNKFERNTTIEDDVDTWDQYPQCDC